MSISFFNIRWKQTNFELLYSYFYINLVRDFRLVIFFTLIAWCFYLYMFWKLGNPFPISNRHEFFSIEQCISRVGIIGVTAMAILSGFGGEEKIVWDRKKWLQFLFLAVNCPYTYMTYFIKVNRAFQMCTKFSNEQKIECFVS